MINERLNPGKQTFLMEAIMKLFTLFLMISTLLVSRVSYAQDKDTDIVKSTQQDLVLVGVAGLGGAVLGLSTLSFYDKPSKHVSNIWMGGAIGVIAGVILVALNNAQKSQEVVDETVYLSPKMTPDFSTTDRGEWHLAHMQTLSPVRTAVSSPLWAARF